MNQSPRSLLIRGVFTGILLVWATPAYCQMQSGSSGGFSGGSSGGGSFGGSSGSTSFGSSGGSSFSGSSGGSFSGSSGGGSFSGSSGGGFTGGNGGGFGTAGGNSFRTTTGAAAAATGVTTYSIAPSNPFLTYYGNPQALGLPGGTGTSNNFGRPLYTLTTTTLGSTGSGLTGGYTTNPTGTQSQGATSFAPSSSGQGSVHYVAGLDFTHGQSTSGKVLDEVRQVLAHSTSLPSRDQIRVLMQGDAIVLQGTVSDEHEQRLAAGLIGLTPGVHDIRNELRVQTTSASP